MVQGFRARTINPRSVMLDWTPPRQPGVTRYRVSYDIRYRVSHFCSVSQSVFIIVDSVL